MINSLKELGYHPVFLTNKYSIILECKKKDIEFIPIKNMPSARKTDLPVFLEKPSGTLTEDEAITLYSRTYELIQQFHKTRGIELMFIWSGIRLIDATAKEFAINHDIRTVFFEIGNFPGKIFADPEGTNAQSLLAKNPNILLNFRSDKNQFEEWRKNYIAENSTVLSVPQSSNVASIDYFKNIKDLYGFRTSNLLKFEPVLTYTKLMNKLRRRYSSFNYDDFDIEADRFIFYPMQVSDDAQLLVHSKIDNIKALEIVADEAKKEGLQLFVKPHPAERNFSYIHSITRLKEKLSFKFVGGNTLAFIKNSEKVVTINSTVGLQSLILQKDFETLSRAYYSDFSQEHLAKYIQSYLLNIDFWATEKIELSEVSELISRARIDNK
ncbi:MAG: hypothetical protein K9G44_00145 [Melioribacteraceae bacterium]|nr:hypothetical protein [Melioribacteraceae bacterium]